MHFEAESRLSSQNLGQVADILQIYPLKILGAVSFLIFIFSVDPFTVFVSMAKIFSERNFFIIFQAFNMDFLEQIRARSWDYLLYGNTFEFYILSLVKNFMMGLMRTTLIETMG